MIDLSIIILSWNTKDLTKQCLESLVKTLDTSALGKSTEVVVVDNGSTDGSVEEVDRFISRNKDLRTILVENKENLGFAKGNNVGIKKAGGTYLMLLNSDTIVKENSLKKMVEYLNEHPEVDIVGPKLLNKDGTAQASCGWFPNLPVVARMLFKEHFGGDKKVRWSPEKSGFVDWLMGAAFVARREVFEKIGGLDEQIFMYMEEVEWFFRASKAGFKAYFLKETEIIHLGRGSSQTGKKEPILNIYRGIIYFYKKHKSPFELAVLLVMLKSKALLTYTYGLLKNDSYLKETYGQAIKIH